jgi:hypothetical protein
MCHYQSSRPRLSLGEAEFPPEAKIVSSRRMSCLELLKIVIGPREQCLVFTDTRHHGW